jgi:hypothetical protein
MMYLITSPATKKQLGEMLDELGTEIKVAVDVRLEVLAGGAALHVDCEEKLLDAGSLQDDVWGATWNAATGEVTFWSVINYRPHLGLRSPDLASADLRARVERIVRRLLEGA